MSAPRLTVGVPFHDEEAYLEPAIRSILAQTFEDFELVLVDDGSTDRSLEIARSFDDPRIVVHSDGRRRHLAARLNEIVQRSRGRCVARMDADDVCHPTRLQQQVDRLEADERLDAVGTLAALVDESEEAFAVVGSGTLPSTRGQVLAHGLLIHASMVARREWLLANPYDATLTLAEDRELWWRTFETSRFEVIPSVLYVIRVLPEEDAAFLAGYQEALRQNRALFLAHGPSAAGLLTTARIVAGTYAKSAVAAVAARAGVLRRLVRRRGRPPAHEEIAMAQAAIAASRTTRG